MKKKTTKSIEYLIAVLDGTSRWDELRDNTGLPEKECKDIIEYRNKIRNKIKA